MGKQVQTVMLWDIECQKWLYLWGRHFTLRTDHQALTTLLATKGIGRTDMRVARWSARLLCFTYDVEYRPGSQNQAVDCLSRLPLTTHTAAMEENELVASVLYTLSVSDVTSSSAQCPEHTRLRAQIEKGWPKCKKDLNPALAFYFLIYHEFFVSDTLVMRGEHCYIVPVSLRATVVYLRLENCSNWLPARLPCTTARDHWCLTIWILHNRRMKTKLDIFPVKAKSDKCTTVRSTVEKQQNKSKQYTDKRCGAKTPAFKPGGLVRVKKPEHVHKWTPMFTPFVLSDKKKWNASWLTRCPSGPGPPAVKPADTAPVTLRRSTRVATRLATLFG